MSDPLFDITFSGEIVEGHDLEQVKKNIAQMFKADETRLAQMFSGNRVVIKRKLDEATAAKYRGAFLKAGAKCDVRPVAMADAPTSEPPVTQPVSDTATSTSAAVSTSSSEGDDYVSRYPESDEIPQALLTEPLGISGDQIEDLGVDIAPVGSPVQHQIVEAEEPDIDTSGFDVAPVGSVLKTSDDPEPPPPPDTSGITMADS